MSQSVRSNGQWHAVSSHSEARASKSASAASASDARKRKRKTARYGVREGAASVVVEYGRQLASNTAQHLSAAAADTGQQSLALGSESRAALKPVVPDPGPGLLCALSKRPLVNESVRLSSFAFVVVRECEQFAHLGRLDDETSVRDIERLGRLIDDFMIENRLEISRRHRLALWAARLKLIDLVDSALPRAEAQRNGDNPENVIAADSSGASSPSMADAALGGRINDPMRVAAVTLSNEELARWMRDNNTCDESVVAYDEHSDTYTHSLQSCGVSALWSSMRALMDAWPKLPLSEHLIAQFEEMRRRVAFFANYRERVDTSASGLAAAGRRKNILGLSVDRWRVRDSLPNVLKEDANDRFGGKQILETKRTAKTSTTKLNSVEFTRVTENGNERFASINEDFLEETERVLHSMLVELRRCAGFDWHTEPEATECDCLACEQLCDDDRTVAAENRFDEFIAEELVGPYRDFTQNEFRQLVWQVFEQPGEREVFTTFNPYDKNTAQNFISRNRRSDAKTINRMYLERESTHVWADLSNGSQLEPPYGLLATIAANYYLQARCKGALLRPYQIDCGSCDPWPLRSERFGERRNAMRDLHTELVTTGTMRLRRDLLPRGGLRCKSRERFYEHPLVLKTIGAFCVYYDGRMHHCPGGYAQAFVVWLAVMCEDREICGELSNGASLFPLYKRLFAERKESIERIEKRIEQKKRDWDPTTNLLPADRLSYEKTQQEGADTQF